MNNVMRKNVWDIFNDLQHKHEEKYYIDIVNDSFKWIVSFELKKWVSSWNQVQLNLDL